MPGLSFSLLTRPPGASPVLFLNAIRFVVIAYLLKSPHTRLYSFLVTVHTSFHHEVKRLGNLSGCFWDSDGVGLNNYFSNVCSSIFEVQVSKTMVIKFAFLSKGSSIGFTKFPLRRTSLEGWYYWCTSYEYWKMIAPGDYLKLSIQNNWLELVMQQTSQRM